MPDVVAPAPVPAAGSPRAQAEVVKPVAPAPVTPMPPPDAKPSAPSPDEILAKAAAERKAAALEKRQAIAEKNRVTEERKTWGEKLKRLGEFEKREQSAKLDPAGFLKSVYGDNWSDVVMEAKVSGTPPANLVAAEMQRLRDELEAKETARAEEAKKNQAAQQQQGVEQARRQLRGEASDFLKASGQEYPALEAIGDASAIAGALSHRIELEYNRSEQRDESGQVTRDGRVLTMREAAELIEADILALAERVAGGAKYQEKLRAKLSPAPTKSPAAPLGGPVVQRTETNRKTLSNDLTGSTPGRAPPTTEADRRARALAAFEAARSKGTS